MLKIRRPLGRLIFNMGIAIPGKTVFLIETTPWCHCILLCGLALENLHNAIYTVDNKSYKCHMMTSSNGNIFRVSAALCGEKNLWSPVNSPHKGQWHEALMFLLICAWMNGWVNNREAGDLRCHRAHYDVTAMLFWITMCIFSIWDELPWMSPACNRRKWWNKMGVHIKVPI